MAARAGEGQWYRACDRVVLPLQDVDQLERQALEPLALQRRLKIKRLDDLSVRDCCRSALPEALTPVDAVINGFVAGIDVSEGEERHGHGKRGNPSSSREQHDWNRDGGGN